MKARTFTAEIAVASKRHLCYFRRQLVRYRTTPTNSSNTGTVPNMRARIELVALGLVAAGLSKGGKGIAVGSTDGVSSELPDRESGIDGKAGTAVGIGQCGASTSLVAKKIFQLS